jgi:wee1-like protein kinase
VDTSTSIAPSAANGGFVNPNPLYRQKSVNLNVPADKLKRMIVKGECGVKLGDFGLARRLDENKPGTIEEGEQRYCARELINGTGPIDLKSADVFSLGATLYELMLGRQLGAGGDVGSVEWHSIRDGNLDEDLVASGLFSAELFGLVKRMVDPNPLLRPSSQEAASTADGFLARLQPLVNE